MIRPMADDAAPTGDEIDPRRLMWRSGSYEIVGDWFRSASVAVLDGLELEGRRLLDVATGTGAVAIEAARRGADVVAVDLTDELVQSARRRSAGAGVDIGFVVGDFDQFIDQFIERFDGPAGAVPFDVVASSFGVIFAPDPAATARRLAAVTAVDGVLVIAAWSPDGVFDRNRSEAVKMLLPPSPPPPPISIPWGTEAGIGELFDGTDMSLVDQRHGVVAIPFESAQDAVDQLERWSGPWQQLFAFFRENGTIDAARSALADDLARFEDGSADGFTLNADYVISTLRGASPV